MYGDRDVSRMTQKFSTSEIVSTNGTSLCGKIRAAWEMGGKIYQGFIRAY